LTSGRSFMAGLMKAKLQINKLYVLLILVFALVASIGIMWFLNNFERKETEIRIHQSPEARHNPLFAATLFLQELGIEAESHRGRDLLVNLPPAGEALFIYRQSGVLSPTQLDNLYDWIDSGGHLIISPKEVLSAEKNEAGDDDLVSRMGVTLRYSNEKSNCGCESKKASAENENETKLSENTLLEPEPQEENADLNAPDSDETEFDYTDTISTELDGVKLDIDFSNYTHLEEGWQDPAFSLISSEQDGAYLLQYTYGSGKVTVLTESSIFDNDEIEDTGHSYLLGWLVKDNHKVWLLYSNDVVGIYTLLYQNLPRFLFSFAGLVVFFIWMFQYRVGALHGYKEVGRRNVLAHIDGIGSFNWRLDQGATMLARTREPVISYWTQRVPGNDSKQIDLDTVAELSGMDRQEVESGLYSQVKSEQDLIAVCRCLQKLRNGGSA